MTPFAKGVLVGLALGWMVLLGANIYEVWRLHHNPTMPHFSYTKKMT